jgi:hypothetical protein
MRKILSLLFVIFVLPLIVNAQSRGSVAAAPVMHAPVVHAPVVHAPSPALHAAPVHVGGPTRPIVHSNVPQPRFGAPHLAVNHNNHNNGHGFNTQHGFLRTHEISNKFCTQDGNMIPGLGFDFEHVAALLPSPCRNRVNTGAVWPWPYYGGGMYVPGYGYGNGGQAGEQAAENTNEEQHVDQGALRYSPPAANSSGNIAAGPASQSTIEFAFVRRDGTVFFAAAYSWQKDKLQYVTEDGLRRMVVPLANLDLDATERLNDERGVSFHRPA